MVLAKPFIQALFDSSFSLQPARPGQELKLRIPPSPFRSYYKHLSIHRVFTVTLLLDHPIYLPSSPISSSVTLEHPGLIVVVQSDKEFRQSIPI